MLSALIISPLIFFDSFNEKFDFPDAVEPEINMIQQEVKMVEQDLESSMKEAEETIKGAGDDASSGVNDGVKAGSVDKIY